MPRAQDILIVVFDAAEARFFKQAPDGRLQASGEVKSGLHRFTREEVSDKPGRTFSSVGNGRHAYEPKHDPHKYEKHEFVHKLAKMLGDAYDKGAFKHLIIVGPKRSIGEFHDIAPTKLRRLVLREVPKEFAKYSEHELEERLRPYL